MSVLPDHQLIEDLSVELGVDPSFIEKDVYATYLIDLLSNLQHEDVSLVFSGGTCLSKGHKLIQRFSEDVDFKIVPQRALSRPKKRELREAILSIIARNDMWEIVEESIKSEDGSNKFQCMIRYPRQFEKHSALRPELKLEVIFTELSLPTQQKRIQSLLDEALKLDTGIDVLCVNPIETAADKISALTWRLLKHRYGEDDYDPTIIRHLHDIAALKETALSSQEFPRMAADTLMLDLKERAQLEVSAEDALREIIHEFETKNEYAAEYTQYVEGMSYAGTEAHIDFITALRCLKEIQAYIYP